MVNHSLNVEVRVGKESADTINSWVQLINDLEIDRYGSLWGESEILMLGSHFNRYSAGSFTAFSGTITPASPLILPSTITVPNSKKAGGSVSGNFGEVLTIFILESKVAPRRLLINHLTSVASGRNAIKCPDLIFESSSLMTDYSIYTSRNPTAPVLPFFIPGECKNNDYLKALRQLCQYWLEIGSGSPLYGFGLISSINYRTAPSVKFNIIVPENILNLENLLSTTPINELKQINFRGCLHGF